MKKTTAILALAMIAVESLAAVAQAATIMPASPVSRAQPAAVGTSTDVQTVDMVCDFNGCYETWDRPPPGYRRPPPPPVYARPSRSWDRHIDWCLDRYRSYNPRTNQFLSSSGYFKTCRSPFG